MEVLYFAYLLLRKQGCRDVPDELGRRKNEEEVHGRQWAPGMGLPGGTLEFSVKIGE